VIAGNFFYKMSQSERRISN